MRLHELWILTRAPFTGYGTGSTNDHQRSWRPRITTHWQDRYIRIFHLRNRTVAASTTAAGIPGLRRISSQTVRNRLRQHGIRPRRSYFGAVLTPLHRHESVRWYNRLRGWTFETGEELGSATSLVFCCRNKIAEYVYIGERFSSSLCSGSGSSVMMWAQMTAKQT
jgi:hypothetical protein